MTKLWDIGVSKKLTSVETWKELVDETVAYLRGRLILESIDIQLEPDDKVEVLGDAKTTELLNALAPEMELSHPSTSGEWRAQEWVQDLVGRSLSKLVIMQASQIHKVETPEAQRLFRHSHEANLGLHDQPLGGGACFFLDTNSYFTSGFVSTF